MSYNVRIFVYGTNTYVTSNFLKPLPKLSPCPSTTVRDDAGHNHVIAPPTINRVVESLNLITIPNLHLLAVTNGATGYQHFADWIVSYARQRAYFILYSEFIGKDTARNTVTQRRAYKITIDDVPQELLAPPIGIDDFPAGYVIPCTVYLEGTFESLGTLATTPPDFTADPRYSA